MSRIHQVLLHSPSDYHNIMMWAACCTAFFGFLRCSEFTIPSPSEFEPATHLSIKDMAIDDKTSSLIRVTIKQSKTDPFRKGVHLFLGRTDNPICPVTAILPYLTACGNTAGQLFTQKKAVCSLGNTSATSFQGYCRLQAAGLPAGQYNTHNFCIGAATSAKKAGIADTHIKMLGRWQSNTYIRTPRQELAALSKQLVTSL